MKEIIYPIAHLFEDSGKEDKDFRVAGIRRSHLIIFDQSFQGG